MMVEVDIEAVDSVGDDVFVVKFRGAITFDCAQRIQAAWHRAWSNMGRPIPSLLILENGAELQSLSGAELKRIGLMRIS